MTIFIITNLTIFIFILISVIIYFLNTSINESEFKTKFNSAKIYFDALFHLYFIPSSKQEISPQTTTEIKKTIKSVYGLEAFSTSYEEHIAKYGDSVKLKTFIEDIINYKFLTADRKMKKSDILYLMCIYKMTSKSTISFALKQLKSRSSYDRYNALQVIASSELIEEFIKALLLVNEEKEYFNDKIIIDFILSSRIEQEIIDNALIENFHLFNTKLAQLVIEYFIIKKANNKDIKNLMITTINKTKEMEIITSVTKYFGEVKVKEVAQIVENNLDSNFWEVRSISARVARYYPSESMIEKLKIVSTDENWFVKENAQKSLNCIIDEGGVCEW